jgi:hypothetical protein
VPSATFSGPVTTITAASGSVSAERRERVEWLALERDDDGVDVSVRLLVQPFGGFDDEAFSCVSSR